MAKDGKVSVPLGCEAKDTITGYQGIVTGKTEWLNGCVHVIIQSPHLHDGEPVRAHSFDEGDIQIIEEAPKVTQKLRSAAATAGSTPGGPVPTGRR